MDRVSPQGVLLERAEAKISTARANPDTASKRFPSTIGGFTTANVSSEPRWVEAYAGSGYVSYRSSLSYERDGFSLPAIIAGIHTLKHDSLGFDFDLVQSLGSARVSALNSVTSYFAYSMNAHYKFRLAGDWTIAPLLFFSQQSITLTNVSVNQVNSLNHFGIGMKGFWFRENYGLAATLSYAPALSNSTTKVSRVGLSLRPGYEITERLSAQLPVSFHYISGTSALGQTTLSTLSIGGAVSYAF